MSQGVTMVENMDDGEELQITDVSGWVWLMKDKESQDGNFGACMHCHQNWGGDLLRVVRQQTRFFSQYLTIMMVVIILLLHSY